MSFSVDQSAPGADELIFLPLGGTGEIGMNMNLYGHDGRWLMIDCGITFPRGGRSPGMEIILPDPAYIKARRDRLAGLLVTHAHEDHVGGVPYLWNQLQCPVYATPFTMAVLRRKLADQGLLDRVPLHEVDLSSRFEIGPFALELVNLTHSIPEPNAVIVRSRLGSVLHTGDWKLDPHPLVGKPYDGAKLSRLRHERMLALVGDSTNALNPGHTPSEGGLESSLSNLIGTLEQRVFVTCFASNIARLRTLARAAVANGRFPAVLGRSMARMISAGRECGYLDDLPNLVPESDIGYLPRNEVFVMCTGSQGEPRAALARIADQRHPLVTLQRGDAVVFSSRMIPGNEEPIQRLQQRLRRVGAQVIDDQQAFLHVSGHPSEDELRQMYRWVQPQFAIPVHGEAAHLARHAEIARDCGVETALEARNGQVIRIARNGLTVVGKARAGRLGISDGRLVEMDPLISPIPVGAALT